ncbi:MAG: DUF4957 domain-containing protein [Paludibacteraceae bacterium]|nr:DUF4957 domain-containing protein [Paludibacteraceae bacterium]
MQTTWVSLWGKNNTVEHCYFAGKTNQGTTFIVWPNDSLSQENHHMIRRNYFGYRVPLGSNGGETMRIGTSHVSLSNSQTQVVGNFFEHCSGEVEIISVKSCENRIEGNTFYECEGSLVLRHGNRNIVDGNVFIGNDKKHTGGVRIVNEGHKVYGNLFYKLAGKEFRSALSIMNGIYNSPLNGYNQVKDVDIYNNTFVSCQHPVELCVGKGFRDRDAKPERVLMANNLFYCYNAEQIVKDYDKGYDVRMTGNIMLGGGEDADNTPEAKVDNIFWNDLFIPTSAQRSAGTVKAADAIGADEYLKHMPEMATAKNCGPSWFTPSEPTQRKARTAKTTTIKPEADALYKAVRKAQNGDVIVLQDGTYPCSKKMRISQDLTIRAADGAKPVITFESESTTVIGFELNDNAALTIDGVNIQGNTNAANPAKYCFSANKENAHGYKLFLRNSEISGFNVEKGGAVFKANGGTFADSIVITDCYIHDCFRGFALAEEKDSVGHYNAETVILNNSVFNRITQWLINYQRLGQDESTSGGSLEISNCVINEVNDREGQTIVRQTGIKEVRILNNIFCNSSAKTAVRLRGTEQTADNNCVYLSGEIATSGGAKATSTVTDNPKFEKKTFRLSAKSSLQGKGIGLK